MTEITEAPKTEHLELTPDEQKLIAAVRAGSTHDATYCTNRLLARNGGATWTYNRSAGLYILGVLALHGMVLSEYMLDSGNSDNVEVVLDTISDAIDHILHEYSGTHDDLARTVDFANSGRSAHAKRHGGAE